MSNDEKQHEHRNGPGHRVQRGPEIAPPHLVTLDNRPTPPIDMEARLRGPGKAIGSKSRIIGNWALPEPTRYD